MGVSYNSYIGPVVVVSKNSDDWLDIEEIDERLTEVRREIRSDDKRYIIPNIGGYSLHKEPKYDHEDAPIALSPDYISEALAKFNADLAAEIEWVRKQFPDAEVTVEFMFLMDAY